MANKVEGKSGEIVDIGPLAMARYLSDPEDYAQMWGTDEAGKWVMLPYASVKRVVEADVKPAPWNVYEESEGFAGEISTFFAGPFVSYEQAQDAADRANRLREFPNLVVRR